MNNFKIPKIRFMNFNDKWKYKILGEISSSIEYGLNASAKDFDGIHKYLRITDIDDSSRLFLADKLSSPDVDFTEGDYENYKLQINDLLFARTGASVGKTYLYRESDGEVYYAGFLIRARLCDSYDGNFVFQQTLTDKYKQFIEITSQRSGQPGINGKEYGSWKIGMTSYSEQSAIGSLFRTLDDLLASYKDNLANYQSLKATMLSKMFPKAGQIVPEIRLEGFEGDWRIVKLGDVLSGLKSGLSRELSNDDIGLPVIRANNISDGNLNLDRDIKYWFKEDPKGANTANYFVKKNDILVNFINSEAKMGTAAIVSREPDRETIYTTNILKLTVKEDYYPYFIYLMTFVQSYQNYIKSITKPAVNQASFTTVDFKKYEFLCPAFQEQQAIGAYFSNLDNLISAHQEKISQLETLKKKLLQDMFI